MVRVISETIQEFDGVRFYRCGFYFQHKGLRLHRAVWERVHGPIPRGYEVHHADHNRANNQPDNLVLLEGRAHGRHHGLDRADESRVYIASAIAKAPEWHRSERGREWHREHYRERLAPVLTQKVAKRCLHCGRDFMGSRVSKYCHNTCKSAARRAAGSDTEQRVCAVCGIGFSVNKYWKNRTCSRRCGARLARGSG